MTTSDDSQLVAAGGWCAPTSILHDLVEQHGFPRVTLPETQVRRGGLFYPEPGSPEWLRQEQAREQQDVIARYVRRLVEDLARAQDHAIELAWRTSDETESVHVYRPRPGRYVGRVYDGIPYRFIGIEVKPGLRAVHIHENHDDTYDEDWDD